MRISHAARTDVGMKRDNNEDNYLVFPEQNLFAVFDGMGGHAAGEVASGIAVREMKEFFDLTGKDPEATWPFKDDRAKNYDENRIITAIKLCNARIMEVSEQDVAHTGDSRVYLFRDNKLKRITIDHSLVEEYLRLGKITEEEAKNFPQKNIILRALGQQRQVEVECNAHDPKANDIFMLMSDGLSGMVEDKFMESIMQKQSANLEACCKKLLDTANANGGVDNSTVILVKYEGA